MTPLQFYIQVVHLLCQIYNTQKPQTLGEVFKVGANLEKNLEGDLKSGLHAIRFACGEIDLDTAKVLAGDPKMWSKIDQICWQVVGVNFYGKYQLAPKLYPQSPQLCTGLCLL